MSISTATELKAALANWSHKTNLTARLDEFIALFEARVNRNLRVRDMEQALVSTALDAVGAVANPTGFLAWKELRYDGSPSRALEPRALQWLAGKPADTSQPLYFAVKDAQTVCWPTSGSVAGTYYQAIPSLTGTASNWLLTSNPDAYLFGCLEEVAYYTRDTEAAQLWGTRAQALLDQIQSSDNANALNGGPLQTRAR